MRRRKIIVRAILLLVILLFVFAAWYASKAFPVISGYGAKNLCSAIYLQHRSPADIIRQDLSGFPFSLARFTVNEKDSSVTGSIWGFAKKKAIYRFHIGCTLINDFTEDEIRKQRFNFPSLPAVDTDTISWPRGDQLADSFPAGIDKSNLDLAVQHAFDDTVNGIPVDTRAVLVVYNRQIVAEKYATGFDRKTVMPGWSMSKSITGALIGILVKQGKLDVNAAAPVAEWQGSRKQSIQLKDLLQQTSGLDYEEVYNHPSEATTMLFRKGDMAAYIASLPLKFMPGAEFNYSSGNSNVLSRIIRNAVGEKQYAAFPYRELFYKTGMYSALLEPDASGTYIGSSYCYATARDFARFGLLYYDNGRWNGEQILPEEWVKESVQPSAGDKLKHYGYQFWLNGFDKKDPGRRWYPDVPADMFFADGYGGQEIYIIPSKQLVIVRLGLHAIHENKFLKEIITALKHDK